MKISGLDYNTQREKLILPEYGREIQQMVDYCIGIPDRAERQHCARAIVAAMERMAPRTNNVSELRQKLWDHLALMSGFRLDIDYPCDIKEAHQILQKPKPMAYPMKRIPVRHYGNLMFELFGILKDMPPGRERDELIRLTANQMKRDLVQWGHGSSDNEKVASDIAGYTHGTVQLDLDRFKFDKIERNNAPQRTFDKKQRRRK